MCCCMFYKSALSCYTVPVTLGPAGQIDTHGLRLFFVWFA